MKKSIKIGCMCIVIACIFVACSVMEKTLNDSDNDNPTQIENTKDQETIKPTDPEEAISFPNEHLQRKDTGKDVKTLQMALKKIGYDLSTSDTYNEETTWAITDFQLQQDLQATGVYNTETQEAASEYVTKEKQIEPGKGLSFEKNVQKTEAGTPINRNPYDQLGLINKHHALPGDFIPEDLVIPDVRFPFTEDPPKKQLRKVAADALEDLFAAGDESGMDLFAQSGYRSYDRQVSIFAANVEKNGEKAANNYSARPGESEHQSGLTMDITSPEIDYHLTIDFADTEEGKWVKKHAAEYGFIIRYPEDKEDITEYQYEPWHLRYVGPQAAKEIMDKGIALEEYLKD